MQLDPPAQEGEVRRRLGGLLVWSGLTLLAALALALALAMVIASLALELGSERHRTQPRRSSSARRAASNWPSERPAGGRWPASSRL
jgi:hypothetical protein